MSANQHETAVGMFSNGIDVPRKQLVRPRSLEVEECGVAIRPQRRDVRHNGGSLSAGVATREYESTAY